MNPCVSLARKTAGSIIQRLLALALRIPYIAKLVHAHRCQLLRTGGLSSSRSGTSQSSLSQGAISRENMTPMNRERPKLKPPVPRFNHASSSASPSTRPSLDRVCGQLPTDTREPTEEEDKKLEATMEKLASSEKEFLSQLTQLRNAHREATLRREQLFGEFNKLSSEERGLMQKVSLIQQKKKNVELSIDSLQDEVAERRSLLERKEADLNDVRQQLDGFRNLSISRLKQYSTKVKKIETERKKFVGLFDLEKARRIKLEEEVHVLEQQGDGDKVLCQICMVNKKNTLVLPCMHFLFCHNCLVIHQTNNNTCPACRGFVTAFLHCKLEMD